MIKQTIATILLVFSGFCLAGAVQGGKEESQELMDSVLPLAEKLLSEHCEFFPYDGAMTPTRAANCSAPMYEALYLTGQFT